MLIKSNAKKSIFLYLIVFTIQPAVLIYKDPNRWYLYLLLESIMVLSAFILYFYWKKRDVLFKSTESGIIVSGSKEGIYDPDYIPYDQIISCKIESKRILISTKDNPNIVLVNLGRNLNEVYNEITNHIN